MVDRDVYTSIGIDCAGVMNFLCCTRTCWPSSGSLRPDFSWDIQTDGIKSKSRHSSKWKTAEPRQSYTMPGEFLNSLKQGPDGLDTGYVSIIIWRQTFGNVL